MKKKIFRYKIEKEDVYDIENVSYNLTEKDMKSLQELYKSYKDEGKMFIIEEKNASYGKYIPMGRTLNTYEESLLYKFAEKYGSTLLQKYIDESAMSFSNEYGESIPYINISTLSSRLRVYMLEQPFNLELKILLDNTSE